MLLLEYPTCSTCKRAKRWLDEHGAVYTSRNIKTEPPTAAELRLWHEKSGLALKRFFNTSGQRYRELDLKNTLPTMSEAAQLALLASDGMLVKRPLLIADDAVLVGFREAQWEGAVSAAKGGERDG